MPRKPLGDAPLSNAERSTRRRLKRAMEKERDRLLEIRMIAALERIAEVGDAQSRAIAAAVWLPAGH